MKWYPHEMTIVMLLLQKKKKKKKKEKVKLCELIFCLKLDLYPRFTLSFCGYFMLVFYISMWMIVLHKPRFGNVNKKTILGQHNSLFAYASLVV